MLYRKVLAFLYEGHHLDKLELPIESGTRRYLLATEPKHQRGNDFITAVEYKGYFMEANKSRSQGLRDLEQLAKLCGLSCQVISFGNQG